MSFIHSETVCRFCGVADISAEHRKAKHWRKLNHPLLLLNYRGDNEK